MNHTLNYHFMKILCALALLALPLTAASQDYIESSTFNTDYRGSQRAMQYKPDSEGNFVSHNGKNLYTRALYGGPTLFRVETSDMPIFAAYHKQENRNIHFTVTAGDRTVRLDSVADCTAYYAGGERRYVLTDPAWGKGTIEMTVVSPYDREGAIWKVSAKNMPKGSELTANACSTVKVKLNRSGDIGADPANAFAPAPSRDNLRQATVKIGGKNAVRYIEYFDRDLSASDQKGIAKAYEATQNARLEIASRLSIDTPDPYINTLGSAVMAAADGIWDGKTWLHGAVGWRMPLSGWRAAYTGDFLGWHDRARVHFDAYAKSQVDNVEPTIAHPSQDPGMNLARAEKKWGTQMYSNGYICRNPEKNNQMHHYDMNLCYMDELLWHFNWTGDVEYAREMWPVIKAHLAWEKRNYDPDDDGLYDAYCCIWASDALYYNSGAVTHSTAYNYRANKLAAMIAGKIGEDPAPYLREADKILTALNSTLWMPEKGVWAEFKDFMGHKRIHDHPALWTIYHAIDSDVADPFQAYRATRYIDNFIPHIAVAGEGVPEGEYATVATTDWMPYAWSINNVAVAEVLHTVLAYYQAGRPDEASKLLKSSMLDNMYMGASPGNIGQISFYDAARGECYRDFGDPVGVMSRVVVQGLFGIDPDAMNGKLTVRPGFPSSWDHASINHQDVAYAFKREGTKETYSLKVAMPAVKEVAFRLGALADRVKSVKINGKPVVWTLVPESLERPSIEVIAPASPEMNLEIEWDGSLIADGTSTGVNRPGFRQMKQGDMTWWVEIPPVAGNGLPDYGIDLKINQDNRYETADLTGLYNSKISDIFENQYLSPRSPYTTLQIPVQGIGEWCHPKDVASIDDSGLRAALDSAGVFMTPLGIPYKSAAEGNNVIYTSLFDNYPDSVEVPLSGKARGLQLLMAGSTNHMQCYMENARIRVDYADGTSETMSLTAPYNWAPIEQDYFVDGKAFRLPTPRPYRLTFKGALVSNNLEKDLGIKDVYGRRIDGGAGVMLCMSLDPDKELKAMTLETISNEVVVGIAALTYMR